jgi:hypothetical protein
MVRLSWICLILLFGNILPKQLFYNSHFLKQNFDLVNVTFSMVNTKDGILVNYCEDLKIRLDLLWVIILNFSDTKLTSSFQFFEESSIIFDLFFFSVQDETYLWCEQSDSFRQIYNDP